MAHPLAGKPPPPELLIDPAAAVAAYTEKAPDPQDAQQRVLFGTSGHRGAALAGSFNEAHLLAIAQAVCEYRRGESIDGPLFLGKDTHALSSPAEDTVLEVLAANGVQAVLQQGGGFTPTPAISRAILRYNRGRQAHLADGLVITPSHNPPSDGGIKYNPPGGGPADTAVTKVIERRANELLEAGNQGVPRVALAKARQAETTHYEDFVQPYVAALGEVLDMRAIQAARLRPGVDPLGGAALAYWEAIAEHWKLDLDIVNRRVDPRFDFVSVDHDGKIRMDCSSRYAMAPLDALRDKYPVAFGNDADADRHGIVVPKTGLMNPNHFLAVAIEHLCTYRPRWGEHRGIGKTVVSSAIIDRVVAALGRRLYEVPVGFKWFAPGLLDGSLCFGGEESAGASFSCLDGSPWSTDKDGILLALLSLEILATRGQDPGSLYAKLENEHGKPVYRRVDATASPEQKAKLSALQPDRVQARELAGEPITAVLTEAPGNGAPLGGLKVASKSAWFAARPSGTENIYKIYAESFQGAAHLEQVLEQAQALVDAALGG